MSLELPASVPTDESINLETSGSAPRPVSLPGLKRHGRMVQWAAVTVLAIVGLVMASAAAVATSLSGPGVVASRGLPIYHVLGPSDIRGGGSNLIGRYTLEPIEKGATIGSGSLGPVLPGALSGHIITSLKVQASSVPITRGDSIELVAMPQDSRTVPVNISDVIILDFHGVGKVTVALPANDLHDLDTTAVTYQLVLNPG